MGEKRRKNEKKKLIFIISHTQIFLFLYFPLISLSLSLSLSLSVSLCLSVSDAEGYDVRAVLDEGGGHDKDDEDEVLLRLQFTINNYFGRSTVGGKSACSLQHVYFVERPVVS